MKKYQIIYADPPWRYDRSGVQGSAEKIYPTMTLEDICNLPVADITDTDAALSVTGVAGPDGGTRECPVGLVYIGCCLHGRVVTERHLFAGDRMQVRKSATDAALHLLARTITEEGTICES